MKTASIVLVVEDSEAAIKSIRESFEVMGVNHRILAKVKEVDRSRITGWTPDGDRTPVSIAWSQVRALFSDFHLAGSEVDGADVVENASFGGVGLIVGMSSNSGFNRRLLAAGAQIAESKRDVILDIGKGRWKLT